MAVDVEAAQICSPGEIEDERLMSALPRGAGLVSGIVPAWGLNMATGFTWAACMLGGERVRGGNGVKRVVLVQFSKRGEEMKLWQEISKLLNVKESQLTLSHPGHNQETLDLPKRAYSAESTSTRAWWNQTLHCSLSQHIPLHFHVTSRSQIPQR